MKKKLLIFLVFVSFSGSLPAQKEPDDDIAVKEFVDNVFHLSEVMLHDVANPPAASRFYAYSLLAAHEIISSCNENFRALSAKLKVDPGFTYPSMSPQFSKSFSAMYAMLEAGKEIMPSGSMLLEHQEKLVELYRKKYGYSAKAIEENKRFAIAVASQVINYAKSDGYNRLSTFTRYTPKNKEGHWFPTPPAYMAPVEPNWNTIRTFFLDSADQFIPAPPVEFDKEKSSDFYVMLQEVYDVTKDLTMEQKEVAAFWDCNPFAVKYSGHVAIGLKKISPGGHWMGISGIACRKAKMSFDSAVLVHTYVALTLHDAFISCWDEKYRSDRIRPETAINKYIDVVWRPMLQTPPFPEYTSGHSVISTASAEILTYLLGDNFDFVDTSEEYFGLSPRSFTSFREAANEAAISRLYGGIHYRDAIEDGQDQGRKVGQYIISKISEEIP